MTCPAHILASNRKHRVIGRAEMDTNSIIHKKGLKSKGDPKGNKDEKLYGLTKMKSKILATQYVKPKNKLKERVVVMVYQLSVNEIKLNINNNPNININTKDENSKGNNGSHRGISISIEKVNKNVKQNILAKKRNIPWLLVSSNEHMIGQNTLNNVVILKLKSQYNRNNR